MLAKDMIKIGRPGKHRSNGDRHLAKFCAHSSTEEEKDEDLDIGKYIVIDGIIAHRDILAESSKLTEEQGIMSG
jgi:hypothetical protein